MRVELDGQNGLGSNFRDRVGKKRGMKGLKIKRY